MRGVANFVVVVVAGAKFGHVGRRCGGVRVGVAEAVRRRTVVEDAISFVVPEVFLDAPGASLID